MKTPDFKELWNKLGNIPINNNEEIEENFLHFEKGTDKFTVWHWFEENFDVVLGEYMYGENKSNYTLKYTGKGLIQ